MSEQYIPEWLKEWLEKEKRHRTINDGQIFVCPMLLGLLRNSSGSSPFHFCPLCGMPLGQIKEEKETQNFFWRY